MDCPDRQDRRKVLRHGAVGLGIAGFIWWLLAYQIGIFTRT